MKNAPLMVPVYCNTLKSVRLNSSNWERRACGKGWAQLVAGHYFCLCCKRRVRRVIW
jgi:hypothetical protein